MRRRDLLWITVLMVMLLSSCTKDNIISISPATNDAKSMELTLQEAQDYFETSMYISPITKSDNVIKRVFYTGDFTPDWTNAKYSKSDVLNGYDVDILSPQYKFAVERVMMVNGEEISYDVEVSQKLVVLKHNKNGRKVQYMLTLIPDKEYYKKHKRNVKKRFLSNSNLKDFSGIAIHTVPQIGIPVSVARYDNGKITSSVYMVARTKEQMLENAKIAFEIMGMMRVKVKERVVTKSSGCGGYDGYWEIGNYTDLGGGFYYDGQDVWVDWDGDGKPDSIWIDPPIIDGGSGGSSGSTSSTPGTNGDSGDNWGGDGLGDPSAGNDGGGGSSGPLINSPSYEQLVQLGEDGIDYMTEQIQSKNFECYDVEFDGDNKFCTFVGAVSSIEGLWASWIPTVSNNPILKHAFGTSLSAMGFVAGLPSTCTTVVAVIRGDISGISESEILNSVSTLLSGVGCAINLLPAAFIPAAVATAGPYIGIAACVFGIAALLTSENTIESQELSVKLSNGAILTIYIG